MANEGSLTRIYDDIYSIVADKQINDFIVDAVSSAMPTLARLKEVNSYEPIGGVPQIQIPILKKLPTATGYTDLGTLTALRDATKTSFIYAWKQLYTSAQVSGLDMIKTDDNPDAIIDSITSRYEEAILGMQEGLSDSTTGIFSNAGESTLTAVTGLQNLLASSTTTGTIGGLNRATLSAIQHKQQDSLNAFNTYFYLFQKLYRQCSRGNENVDTIILNGSTYDNYVRRATATINLVANFPEVGSQRLLDLGFLNVKYLNAVILADDYCPENVGYFLNTDYHKIYVRKGRDMELGDPVKSQSADDIVSFCLWAGNQTNSNPARCGNIVNCDTY